MPKIVDHDQRRILLAQAAVTVIAERGLDATKLTDIARLAGVTTGAVTHYYKDKDAILMAALERAYDITFSKMELIAKNPGHTLHDVLIQALPLNKESRIAMSVWLAFWSRSLAEPRIAKQQMDFHNHWHEKVKQEMLHHCKRMNVTLPADPDDMCEGITAQINGLIIRGLVDAPEWSENRLRKVLKTYLIQIGLLDN